MYSSEEKNKQLFYDLFIKSLIENHDFVWLLFTPYKTADGTGIFVSVILLADNK